MEKASRNVILEQITTSGFPTREIKVEKTSGGDDGDADDDKEAEEEKNRIYIFFLANRLSRLDS